MTGLFYAHSGLRYLVLLVGIAAIVYFAFGLFTRRPADRAAGILMAAFTGLLDLQIVLGLLLIVMGLYYPALIGHMVMMIAAAVVAHVTSVFAKRTADDRRSYAFRLGGSVLGMVLIVGGITAIGRGIFESGAPSIGM
jgi:hypothetical protein